MKNVNFDLLDPNTANMFGVTRKEIQEAANAVEGGANMLQVCKILLGKHFETMDRQQIRIFVATLNFYEAIGMPKKKKIAGKRINGKLFLN
jgi:hypothetical protein